MLSAFILYCTITSISLSLLQKTREEPNFFKLQKIPKPEEAMDKQLVVSFDEPTTVFHPSNNNETENRFLDEFECIEGANKKLRLAPKENKEQGYCRFELIRSYFSVFLMGGADLTEALMNLVSPLGLQLKVTPNFLESVESVINFNPGSFESKPKQQTTQLLPHSQQPMSEKLKASNFSVSFLKIGNWERMSRNEGDLVAKCYFAKKKLVWEFLKQGLKIKIEIQWSDIIALRADIKENEPGILEIELNNPPTFHEETDPQPRKHTIWKLTSDFTTGEASHYRRHYLRFPPGSLDKHYEKLLQYEPRLLKLTQKPFPSLKSPYFNQDIYGVRELSFSYNGHGFDPANNVNLAFQYNFPRIPPSFVSPHHVPSYQRAIQASFKETTSPVSVMDFTNPSDEYHHISKQIYEDQSIPFLTGQGISSNYTGQQLQAIFPSFPMHQNYDTQQSFSPGSAEGLDYIPKPFGQAVMPNSDHRLQQMARVASLTGILSQAYNADENFHSYACDQADELGGMYYPQPINCIPSDVFTQNTVIHQTWNHLGYALPTPSDLSLQGEDSSFAPVASDASIQNFGQENRFDATNHWELRHS